MLVDVAPIDLAMVCLVRLEVKGHGDQKLGGRAKSRELGVSVKKMPGSNKKAFYTHGYCQRTNVTLIFKKINCAFASYIKVRVGIFWSSNPSISSGNKTFLVM